MKRYIDANVAIYKIVTNKNFIDGDKYPHDCCCDIIEAMPTADVVEVVRCRNCRYGHQETENINGKIEVYFYCDGYGLDHSGDYYCADGERRE